VEEDNTVLKKPEQPPKPSMFASEDAFDDASLDDTPKPAAVPETKHEAIDYSSEKLW